MLGTLKRHELVNGGERLSVRCPNAELGATRKIARLVGDH
jgi:hypothetical protein